MEEKKHCKWYHDEFCTNDKSPCVADYCHVVEYPELCKCRELDNGENLANVANNLANDDTEIIVNITDEKIIKALECMANSLSGTSGYTVDIIPYALDLIQRLQDENKRLSLIAGIIDKGVAVEIVNMEETIDMQKAEIERLNKFVMSEEQVRKCCADIIQETIVQVTKDTAKAFWFMAVTKIRDELNPDPKEKDTSFSNGVIGARYRALRIINTICKEQFGVEVE